MEKIVTRKTKFFVPEKDTEKEINAYVKEQASDQFFVEKIITKPKLIIINLRKVIYGK